MLLERAEQVRALTAALARARDGHGSTVLIGGEAGTGKSTLAAHLAAAARCRVLRSGCDGTTTAAPLGPLTDVADVLDVDPAGVADRPVDRVGLFASVRTALAAEPTVWLVEDLHWADVATLDLVRYLARRGADVPVLLVLTFRDDEVGADDPLRVLLGELATAPAVQRLAVPPLSRDAVGELARGSGVDPGALFERTGGNAFFVTEVLAGPDAAVPPTVRDAVLARAARLSAPARDVLAAAAVIGSRADIDVLLQVAGHPGAALDECLRAGVLRGGGPEIDGHEIGFGHELAREVIAAGVLPGRRRDLHAAAYAALAATGADDRRLAHHAARAGDGASVLRHAPNAASLAAAYGAHREAAEHYRAALRWGHLVPAAERSDLLGRLSYECYLTGDLDEATDARSAELALRREGGDRAGTGSALRWMSRLSWQRLRNADAERYGEQAVGELEGLPDGPELAMAYSNLAQLRMLTEDVDGARRWGQRAVELARRLGDLDTEVHALNNLGTALLRAGDEEGSALLQQSLDTAVEHDMQEHAARAYTNLAAALTARRRYGEGEDVLRTGMDYCAERDLDRSRTSLQAMLAVVLLETGRWAAAGQLAQDLAAAPVARTSRVTALLVLGRLATRTGGDPALLTEAWEMARPSGEAQRLLSCAAALAEAAWTRGDLTEVRRRVDAVWALAIERGNPWELGELRWWLQCAGQRPAVERPVAAPFTRMLDGEAGAAAAVWDGVGNPFWAALASAGSGDPARLRAAVGELEALGATATRTAVARELRRRGLSVPRGPSATSRANPAGLTGREMEVLHALAEGLSNAEIAARFVLSAKTVDHHVSAVLRKLREPSRSRAVAAARRAGILGPTP